MADLASSHSRLSILSSVTHQLQPKSDKEALLLQQITDEEKQAILSKLQQLVTLPAGPIPSKDSLYMQQQVSDLLGMTLTAELEGKVLPHVIGLMKAAAHVPRYPTDTISDHLAVPEAGMSGFRSAFGWYTQQGNLLPSALLAERYYIALPLHYFPEWQSDRHALQNWYKNRKMLVINPLENRAVACSVGTIGPSNWLQYQFAGSPELIRSGRIWSLKAMGKVIVFFIDDPEDEVTLGPIELENI